MHSRNLHSDGYNFKQLVSSLPSLSKYIIANPNGRQTIDFSNPEAVICLNTALLKEYYNIAWWKIPSGYLCPPIPGRADYIHHLADLINESNAISKQSPTLALDIGTGANLIYPIIGSQQYDWQFIASDVDKIAIKSAQQIQAANPRLGNNLAIRHQVNPTHLFEGIIKPEEQITFTMCNPPFHTDAKAALAGTQKKNLNLHRHKSKRQGKAQKLSSNKDHLNFSGKANELWCVGGEVGFIQRMIIESVKYQKQVIWFTTLVSKKHSLPPIYKTLTQVNAAEVKTINMSQGSKISRFIAWRY